MARRSGGPEQAIISKGHGGNRRPLPPTDPKERRAYFGKVETAGIKNVLTLPGSYIRVDQRRAYLAKLLVTYPADGLENIYQRMLEGDAATGTPAMQYAVDRLQRDIVELRKEWRKRRQEDIDTWRAQEDEMLLRLHEAVAPAAMKGDLDAIDRVLKISERRARLLGLDAPARSESRSLSIQVIRGEPVRGPKIIEAEVRKAET